MTTQLLVSWLKKACIWYLTSCCVAGVVISYQWGRAIWAGRDYALMLPCFMTESAQIDNQVEQNMGTSERKGKK